MPKIVIVGAGISGLSLAFRLQQLGPDFDVTILEERDRAGGTVWTFRENGFQVEAGPNGFLDNKPSTLALCRDLGLESKLVRASGEASKNRYLFLDGRLRPLPGSLAGFLKSDLLSWRGKAAFFMERFRRPRKNGQDESIAAFARRRAGPEAAKVFADALVTGIFAGDPDLLSMPACFPRLTSLELEYGSVLKGLTRSARQRRLETQGRPARPGGMWSLQDGLGCLIEALQSQVRNPPVLGVAVRGLRRQENDWVVLADGKEAWSAAAVVLTCPAYEQAAILGGLDSELAERVGAIAYNRVVVVALGFKRVDVPGSVAGFGYIAPQGTRRDVLGVQWCSSIFPGRAPGDNVLFRAMAGGWHRSEVAGWDDARLVECVRSDLRQAMGVTAPPIFQRIIRWNRAIPQYHLGHRERVAWIEQRTALYPGLFLGGNAYEGVALNDCTEQGGVVAAQVGRFFR